MPPYLDFGSFGDALTVCSCRQKLALLFLLQGMAGAIGISTRAFPDSERLFQILDHSSSHTLSSLEVV